MGLLQRLSSKVRNRKSLPPAETPPDPIAMTSTTILVPETQKILLLYAPRQPYQVVEDYAVPKLQSDDEVLVRTRTIGLNPIDWKAP